MHNVFLPERAAVDIDRRVGRLLKDLDVAEPPIRLELVRDLLQLDLRYYSANDTGLLAETVHRLKVAGKQIIQRPGLLLDVVRKRELKALWIPDRRRILLDSDLPSPKQRWGEAHEIGHSIIPWHDSVMHGDHRHTLSLACEQEIEAEANYAAGRLLFMRDRFDSEIADATVSFQLVKELGSKFKNTMTSTLWRVVESSAAPCFGLVGIHPRDSQGAVDPARYFIRSKLFEARFATVGASHLYEGLRSICRRRRGPIGNGEFSVTDVDGTAHVFLLECFYNGHEALTLGTYRGIRAAVVAVP